MFDLARKWTTAALAVAALSVTLAVGQPAFAQKTWPTKPITLIVPGAPGSSTDNVARVYAERLSQLLGQPIVAENRAGAEGAIGSKALVSAKPDGYTLMIAGNSILVLNAFTVKNLAYDAEKDFVNVGQLVSIPFGIAVTKDYPASSFKELLALSKEKETFFATPGAASISRLIGEWLNQKAGTKLANIAYPSSAHAHTDLIAGRVPIMIDGLGGVAPHVKSGRVRLLAVTTRTRAKAFEDVPTVAEFVPGFVVPGVFAIVAPPGTPAEIVETLNREIRVAAQDPKVGERMAVLGAEASSGPTAELDRLLKDQRTLFKGLVEQAKLKPE